VDAIARRFDDARIDRNRYELLHRGSWYRVRVTPTRISVAIPRVDGFTLALRWSDRWVGDDHREIDDSFFVETNDLALAHLWLDGGTRDTLFASRYMCHERLDATARMTRDGSWIHEVTEEGVIAHRSTPEDSPQRLADLVAASIALASRPVEWARSLAVVAKRLGAQSSSRIELGGRPALRALRGNLEVCVHLLRRLSPDEPGRLRTLVTAQRPGSGDRLALVRDGRPHDVARPATISTGALLLDGEAARLLDRARPATAGVHAQEVEITFDGALLDADRLGAAIELAARWSAASMTPYR